MAATQKAKGRTALEETSNDGAFKRKDATYRNIVEKGGDYPPEGNSSGSHVADRCVNCCMALQLPSILGMVICDMPLLATCRGEEIAAIW